MTMPSHRSLQPRAWKWQRHYIRHQTPSPSEVYHRHFGLSLSSSYNRQTTNVLPAKLLVAIG
ncbi:hypothetical protein BDN71DRAFT_1496317 [Pleurotus eryngii]|uniref:Uncharacterized protein n=1 Tax=Pleurotus eryngii TaxID=5323 RepID=A0A9P5ZZU5_PLEER|nr:hypothetical protein BDN71DRAFT_1496317 [Pleurotus eryngii]